MNDTHAFDTALLSLIDETAEVDIATVRTSGELRRTIIWLVTDGEYVYARSVRGAKGWWYRDLQARPTATIHVGSRDILVAAVPATDDASIELVSRLLREKYERTSPASTESMLQPHTLETTMRLLRT